MISIKKFRTDFENLVKKLKVRGVEEKELLLIKQLDQEYVELKKKIENLNFQKNSLSKQNQISDRETIKKIKEELVELNKLEIETKNKLNQQLHLIPNIPSDDLKEEQIVVSEWGNIDEKKHCKSSHIELGEQLNLFNFSVSSTISGAGHVVYVDKGEKLFRALINFSLDENEKQGYKRHYMPVIVNEDSLFCTSQISKFSEMLFKLNNNKFLSPTGETQLVNLYRNALLSESDLPIKLTTNTNCFRNESVGAGVESKGLLRLYQFCKTEIVVICKEEDSEKTLQDMCEVAENILKKLNLPYRKILLANNDIGFAAAKTYDLEVWIPSENKYREISSISNTLDFQSRRGMIRWKTNVFDKAEKSKYVHLLNGSSLAIDRLFAAVVENYQTSEGAIEIPKALQKYLDFSEIKK